MEQSSERRDIILIGGSAGALEGLKKIVARLPADLPASLFVTLHIARESPGVLPEILNRCGPLPARLAAHGERIERGIIYVAPPDFHLLVHPGHTHVSRGPRENRHRPAIDPMFRTAARAYRNRVAAVILSGLLDDGAAGLMAVRAAGGLAIVQDPAEESWGDMARAGIDYAGADYILPLEEIGSFIEGLAGGNLPIRSAAGEARMPHEKAKQKDEAELKTDANQEHEGDPSPFACPECHGVLWEVEDGHSCASAAAWATRTPLQR